MAAYKLQASALKEASGTYNRWAAVAEDGTTIEDLQRPEFWSHHAHKLRQMDIIDILAEDGSYYAEFMVLQSGVGFAKVLLLREVKLEVVSHDDDDLPVVVQWKGPQRKHSVIRKADGMVLRDGFTSKGDAWAFAGSYAKTVAA